MQREISPTLVKSRILVVCATVGILVFLSRGAPHEIKGSLIPGAADYQLSGSFAPHGAPAATKWLRKEDEEFSLGSHSGNDPQTGTFVSGVFTTPATLSLFVSGYPSHDGKALYLRSAGDSEKLRLACRDDPGRYWQYFSWSLPKAWQGRRVRLVAEDRSVPTWGAWLGITLPRKETAWSQAARSFSKLFLLVSRICVEAAFFLLPGIALAWWIQSRRALDVVRFVATVLVGSAATGYVAFWPYLLGPATGKLVSVVLMSLALAAVLYAAYKIPLPRELLRGLLLCSAMMALVTCFHSAIGFLYERSPDPAVQAEMRFIWPLPVDNVLPNIFVNDLYTSKPFRPFMFIDWKSSDRPPLQTAIVLLQRPLWPAAQEDWDYQTLGTLLQSAWIASLWILLQILGVKRSVALAVFLFCLCSAFFILQTFYVWPKLLAGAFFVLAICVLRFPEGSIEHCDFVDTILGGAAIGLAMLSHGGIAFSILGFAIVILLGRRLPRLRPILWGSLALLLLMLPWMAYQKFYDPPGDRLLKWHLAGVVGRDSRSFGRAFVDAYTKVALSQLAANKLANLKTLVAPGGWGQIALIAPPGVSESKHLLNWYKSGTFYVFFQTLGLLNFGFIAFLYAKLFANPNLVPLLSSLQRLFVLAFVSLLVWCLLIYLPGTTIIHVGSYGTVILMFAALGISLATAFPRLACIALAIQGLFLFPLFSITDAFMKSRRGTVFAGGADPGLAFLAIGSFAVLFAVLWSAEQQQP